MGWQSDLENIQDVNGKQLGLIAITSEHIDRENPAATVHCICTWEDRLPISAQLVGGILFDDSGNNPSYQTPQEYWFARGIFCSGVDVTPAGNFGQYGYQDAYLDVSFGALKILDYKSTGGIGICEVSSQTSCEALPLPVTQYQWQNGDVLDPDTDIQPQKSFVYTELDVKVIFSSSFLPDDSLIGKVNSDVFYLGDTENN